MKFTPSTQLEFFTVTLTVDTRDNSTCKTLTKWGEKHRLGSNSSLTLSGIAHATAELPQVISPFLRHPIDMMCNKWLHFSYSPPKWRGQTESVAWYSHQMELQVVVVVMPEVNHLGKNVSYIENGWFIQGFKKTLNKVIVVLIYTVSFL